MFQDLKNSVIEYIPLSEAGKILNTSRDYMNVLVRRGKLRAVKLGRNWVTTKEWIAEYCDSLNISKFKNLNISKIAAEEKDELRILKSNLILEREKALEAEAFIPEIAISSRELKIEERKSILESASAKALADKAVNKNLKTADSKSFIIASKQFGILKSLKQKSVLSPFGRSPAGRKFAVVSGLAIILLTTAIGFSNIETEFLGMLETRFPTSTKYQANIFSDVFKNFPNDIPIFYKWLANNISRSLAFLKFKNPSELTIGKLSGGSPKIVKPQETFVRIDTLEEALALDASTTAPGMVSDTQTSPVSDTEEGAFTLIENRLSTVEADFAEQKILTKAELSLQKKTILGTLETLIGISKLLPTHPISTIVVQGQPSTLTSYSIAPQVQSGFDRLSATSLNLSGDAIVNGHLTVRSGGEFNTLSVSGTTSLTGNVTLTGNATIGGTLSVAGNTTLQNLIISGTLSATAGGVTIANASSTYLTVSNTAWITNGTITNGTITNASTTYATLPTFWGTTGDVSELTITNATSTRLFATNGTITNASTTYATLPTFWSTNGTITNASTTYLTVSSNLWGNTGQFTTSLQTPLIWNSGPLTASTTGANPLIFATNSSERMRIDESGKVVIATTTIPSGFGLNIATSTFVYGNQFISGGLGVGIATTTSGAIQTKGDVFVGRNLYVSGNSTTLGASSADTLTVNSSINSNLIPDQNVVRDLGSTAFYWKNAYIGTLTANNISAASTTIGGTQSETFTINSDNATADVENATLIFFRGTVVPNALLTWNAATSSKRFEFNQTLYINNGSASTTNPTLTVQTIANQTAVGLQVIDNNSANIFSVSPVSSKTTMVNASTTNLTVSGNLFIGSGSTGAVLLPDGTVDSPSLSFISDTDTGLFRAGDGKMSFGTNATTSLTLDNGKVIVGNDISTASYQLEVADRDANNNTIVDELRLSHFTTGTADNGLGAGLLFYGQDSTGAGQNMARIAAQVEQATSSNTFASRLIFSTVGSGGLLEKMRLTGNGQLLLATTTIPSGYGANIATSTNIYGSLRAGTSSSLFLVDNSTGNVGIGTTTPITTFAVNGNGYFGSALGVGILNTTANTFRVGQCVTGDTRLRRRRRRRKISNLKFLISNQFPNDLISNDDEYIYDEPMIIDIKPGDEVLSLNEKTGELIWRRVKQLAYMGIKDIYKLTTESGKTIRTTGNHPYFVRIDHEISIIAYLRRIISGVSAVMNQKTPQGGAFGILDMIRGSGLTSFYIVANEKNLSSVSVDNNINQLGIGPAGNRTPENLMSNQISYHTGPNARALYQENNIATRFNGLWTKVVDLKEGMEIAVVGDNNKSTWDKIVSIEYLPEEEVYDIEIEDTHNFIANGIVAHNTAFIVDSTGKVGIGTTTPNNLLTIAGHVNQSLNFKTNSTNSGWAIGVDTADSNKFKIASSTAVGTNARLTINGNGNVGIGLTNPEGKLHIQTGDAGNVVPQVNTDELIIEGSGDAGLSIQTPDNNVGRILFSSPTENANAGIIFLGRSDGGLTVGTEGISTGYLAFHSGLGIEKMRITSAGNVGIGTTTPLAKLDVWGNGKFFGTLSASSTAYFDGLVNANAGLTVIGATSLQNATATNGFAVSGSSFNVGGQNFMVQTSGAASSTSLAVSGASNLGGLITSQSGLTITGGNLNLNNLGITNAGSIAGATTGAFSTSIQTPLIYNAGPLTASTTGANPLIFATNSSERMRIDSSGNVGIGTTSPNNLLSLFKSTTPALGFTTGSGDSAWTMGIDTADANKFKIASSTAVGTNTRLTIDGNGNVGIGTASPSVNLHIGAGTIISPDTYSASAGVFSPDNARFHISGDVDGGASMLVLTRKENTANERNIAISAGNGLLRFGKTNDIFAGVTAWMAINVTSGNVGIGTTSPQTKLEVTNTSSGATADQVYLTNLASATSTASRLTFRAVDIGGAGTSTAAVTGILTQNWTTGKGDLAFSTLRSGSLTEAIRITNLGYLGVGTTSPGSLLSVAGHCVTGDSKLRRRKKRRGKNGGIEYEYDEVEVRNIKSGDEILSLNEKTGKLIWSRVNALMDMGVKPIYKLTTASGKTIRTTGNHPYLTKYGWVKVAELREGNEIAVTKEEMLAAVNFISSANTFNRNPAIFDREFNSPILSYSVSVRRFRIIRQMLRKFQRIWRRSVKTQFLKNALTNVGGTLFEKIIRLRRVDNLHHDNYSMPYRFANSSIVTNFPALISADARLSEARYAGLNVSMSSTVVSSSSLSVFDNFQSTVSASKISDSNFFISQMGSLGLFNPPLNAWEFQTIFSSLSREVRSANNFASNTAFGSRERTTSRKDINGFDKVWLFIWRKFSKLTDKLSNNRNDFIWDQIKKIERLPTEQVYDIEVEGTHNFVANDIIAHNTYLSGNLTVSGTTNLQGISLTNASSTYLTVSDTAWINKLNVTNTTSTSTITGGLTVGNNAALSVDRNAAANSLFIDPSGNVGIGTTSPNNLLSLFKSTTPALGFTTGSGDSAWTMGIDTADANKFKIASSTAVGTNARLTIDGNGNVGINTTSPTSTLAIAGTLNVQQTTTGISSLYVNSSGNVGIGTTGPTNKLELLGSAAIVLRDSAVSHGMTGDIPLGDEFGRLQIDNATDGGLRIRGIVDTNTAIPVVITGTGQTTPTSPLVLLGGFQRSGNGVAAASGATPVVRISPNATGANSIVEVLANGKVGIGTTTPGTMNGILVTGATMHISGNTTGSTISQLLIDGTGQGILGLNDSGAVANSRWFQLLSDGGDFTLRALNDNETVKTTILTAQSTGNVGIGTTSPQTKLEVTNTSSGATADQLYLTNLDSATSTASRLTFRAQDISGATGTSTAAITGILTQNWTTGKGDLAFSTLRSGALTEAMRITDAGNVGIGTANPTVALEIGSGQILLPAGSAAAPSLALGAAGTGWFRTSDVNTLSMSTGGVERLRIDTGSIFFRSGNELSWYSTSDFSGSIDLTVGRDAANILAQRRGTNAQEFRIYNTDSAADEFASLGFINNANVFTIETEQVSGGTVRNIALLGGNVGIGTTSPNNLLSLFKSTTPALGFTTGSGDSAWTMGIDTADANKFKIASSTAVGTNTRLTIDGNGNVGIGTTAPAGTLELLDTNPTRINMRLSGLAHGVTNDAPSTDTFGTLFNIGSDDGGLYVMGLAGANTRQAIVIRGVGYTSPSIPAVVVSGQKKSGADAVSMTGTDPVFGVDAGTFNGILFRILANGNVGIGTTTPTQLLTISSAGTTANANIPNGALCIDNDGGCVPGAAGNITFVSSTTGNSDVAENYYSSEVLEAGDIIEYSKYQIPNTKYPIQKAAASSTTIIGVVSSAPGMTLGFEENANASSTYPVALIGRVPVKVNLENGPIAIGDRISVSSVAGIGKKASSTEATVGIALEEFSASNIENCNIGNSLEIENCKLKIGKILVFVNLGQPQLAAAKGTGDLASMTTASGDLNMNGFSLLNVKSISGLNGLWSIDAEGNIIAKSVTAQALTIAGAASGVTVYDRTTAAPKCIYIEGGVIKTSDGACGQTQNAGAPALISNSQFSISNEFSNSNDQTATTTPATSTTTEPVLTESEPVVATSTEPVIISETATSTP